MNNNDDCYYDKVLMNNNDCILIVDCWLLIGNKYNIKLLINVNDILYG